MWKERALHRLDALLGRDHLPRALPGPRVGLRALPARRQALAVAQAPVAADLLQTVDVLRDGPLEVPLGRITRLDDGRDASNLLVREVLRADVAVDPRLLQDLRGEGV